MTAIKLKAPPGQTAVFAGEHIPVEADGTITVDDAFVPALLPFGFVAYHEEPAAQTPTVDVPATATPKAKAKAQAVEVAAEPTPEPAPIPEPAPAEAPAETTATDSAPAA